MNLNAARTRHPLPESEAMRSRQAGDEWLAGATWLYPEPAPETAVPIHRGEFNGPSLSASSEGLEISTHCTIAELNDFIAPHDWIASPLLKECCRSLLASSTGGNPAAAGAIGAITLPTGALISLAAALEGVCTVWPLHGSPREIPAIDFISGNHPDTLAQGESFRGIWIPAAALRKHYTLRRFSLTASGRASVLLAGTLCPDTGAIFLTITGATTKPVQLVFPDFPSAKAIHMAINEHVPFDHLLEDPYASPMHRRHLTYHYAENILNELSMI